MQALEKTPLEPEIIEALRKHFNEMENFNETKFAIRSSAIGEDSADTSSAGQNETFLGVNTFEEVCDSIRKCWASMFSLRSVQYRRQHLQTVNNKMAVVVQQMVASDAAGVLFTQHPTTGHTNKLLITANYGLGEVSTFLLVVNVLSFLCT